MNIRIWFKKRAISSTAKRLSDNEEGNCFTELLKNKLHVLREQWQSAQLLIFRIFCLPPYGNHRKTRSSVSLFFKYVNNCAADSLSSCFREERNLWSLDNFVRINEVFVWKRLKTNQSNNKVVLAAGPFNQHYNEGKGLNSFRWF